MPSDAQSDAETPALSPGSMRHDGQTSNQRTQPLSNIIRWPFVHSTSPHTHTRARASTNDTAASVQRHPHLQVHGLPQHRHRKAHEVMQRVCWILRRAEHHSRVVLRVGCPASHGGGFEGAQGPWWVRCVVGAGSGVGDGLEYPLEWLILRGLCPVWVCCCCLYWGRATRCRDDG